MKARIKEILRENTDFTPIKEVSIDEVDKVVGMEYNVDDKVKGSYERIVSILKNNIINHAGIMDVIWRDKGGSDATNRSLFGKKLDKNNKNYRFSEEELSKIKTALESMSGDISKAYSKNK